MDLTDREKKILDAVVRNYIVNAAPTGSRILSKLPDFPFSAATIRNVMADLEEKNLIKQPHTSAGRIPTDLGYRFYVDQLRKEEHLPKNVRSEIRNKLRNVEHSDLSLLLETTSNVLSRVTNQLGIVLSPKLCEGLFKQINIFKIDSGRYVLNLAIDSGFVKTLVVELSSSVSNEILQSACNEMNQKYREHHISEILKDYEKVSVRKKKVEELKPSCATDVIKLFIPSIKKIFTENVSEDVYAEGKTNIITKPDFFSDGDISAIVEVLKEKKVLMHMLASGKRKDSGDGRVEVSIGGEIKDGIFSSFSVVKAKYKVGTMEGSLGVIGPKRMPYPYLISAVDYTSKVLEEYYK